MKVPVLVRFTGHKIVWKWNHTPSHSFASNACASTFHVANAPVSVCSGSVVPTKFQLVPSYARTSTLPSLRNILAESPDTGFGISVAVGSAHVIAFGLEKGNWLPSNTTGSFVCCNAQAPFIYFRYSSVLF